MVYLSKQKSLFVFVNAFFANNSPINVRRTSNSLNKINMH